MICCSEAKNLSDGHRWKLSFVNLDMSIESYSGGSKDGRSAGRTNSVLWGKIESLKCLYDEGYISKEEFEERKNQLIDQLTGTKKASLQIQQVCESSGLVPIPPPDFSTIPTEKAVKHMFNPHTRSWTKSSCQVKLDLEPFAQGTLRKAYHLQILGSLFHEPKTPTKKGSGTTTYVAKLSIDPYEDRETYFCDVETQMYAKEWAERFNLYRPPKRVDFIACSVLELIDRPGRPICGVERFINGPYRKHNNNTGYVSEDERNTPQAFSHFTYYASNMTLVICDIQGVGDSYTDPQIHTIANLKGVQTVFGGKGNMGSEGLKKFIKSHKCNLICRYLRLPPVSGQISVKGGTLPATPLMEFQHVEVLRLQIKDATKAPVIEDTEETKLLPTRVGIEEESSSRFSCICCVFGGR